MFPRFTYAGNLLEISPISISAVVVDPNVVISPGGGGNSGGSSGISIPTTVNFSGMAYPNSKVTILNNGNIAVTTIADPSARFSVSLNNLETGTYSFSVFGEDKNGMKSLSFSFPVYVTSGTAVNIGGIFLSPTINIDKSEVKKGDDLTVYGQTVPNSNVNIVFNSDQEIVKKIKTDFTGLYKYVMDTTPLPYGDHKVKSKTLVEEEVKAVSAELPFVVSTATKIKDNTVICNKLRGDLNCDGHVSLTDFSIMAFWYKKANPPAKVDLNSDGIVTLVDFSIMVFNWTG